MIDKILQLRRQGVLRHTAIVAASTLRLRPVLMTALAAGAAMFPVAISPPPATEQFRNIATAITGGLITSTLMTLIVIPVAYSLMDDFVVVMKRLYLGKPPAAEVAVQPPAVAASAGGGAAGDTELEPAKASETESQRSPEGQGYGS